VLEIKGLTKRYHRVPVVDCVSFRIDPGEVCGYLGPNGSGKTTTVQMLTGLLDPSDGAILFNGQDIRSNLIGYRKRLGYVPEGGHEAPNVAASLTRNVHYLRHPRASGGPAHLNTLDSRFRRNDGGFG